MNFLFLRQIHGYLYEKKLYFQRIKKLKKYLKYPFGEKAYILGTPVYENLGDSAIVLAQLAFLQSAGWEKKRIKEITFSEYYQDREIIRKIIKKKHPIFGLGGGNMGNQWPLEEKFRYDMMDDFSANPLVIFPQTIYYKPNSREDEQTSIRYYNGRKGLTIVAREKKSLETMQELYPYTKVLLTPDIVLSASMENFGVVEQERRGALLCIRNDAEKAVPDSVWKDLEEELIKNNIFSCRTDMYSECSVTKENRADCVRKKMQEFRGAEIVVTDRLHGMVFAAITGTPCIVFSNYNHKVKGTYDWISYLPYVRYVETVEQAKAVMPELVTMKKCKFDNLPLKPYFEKLKGIVKNNVSDSHNCTRL